MQADVHRLRRRLARLSRNYKSFFRNGPSKTDALDSEYLKLLERAEASAKKLDNRKALQPRIEYPAQLPINEYRNSILKALEEHQVLIVSGETGSGKTTQLPKFCLEASR